MVINKEQWESHCLAVAGSDIPMLTGLIGLIQFTSLHSVSRTELGIVLWRNLLWPILHHVLFFLPREVQP